MKKFSSILLTALIITVLHGSLASSATYSVFSGYDDSDYQTGKYKMLGLLDAFDALGLNRVKYINSTTWQFYENTLVDRYWTYTYPQFDSCRADYPTLSAFVGHAGTFKDRSANDFYFTMKCRDSWQGISRITSDTLRLGEACGYFSNDQYQGLCRYFMALGCNTIAIGPAMDDDDYPTYSRPDLFNKYNSNHANPFKIWRPVMTNGLRMAMGFTDYSYRQSSDRGKWKKFKDYWFSGQSIARSFAYTALDAHRWHKPVVLAMGANSSECEAIMNERSFRSSRPSGKSNIRYTWWGSSRVRDYDGRYVWDNGDIADGPRGLADEAAPLPSDSAIYESIDSTDREDATLLRYLDLFGFKSSASLYDPLKDRAVYTIDEKRQVCINNRTGSLYYHDADVSALTGPCQLSKDECIDRAVSVLIDSQIVSPTEVEVDSVISEHYMVATTDGTDNASGSEPKVARYTVVFKRKLGGLPILTNDTDTIRVEIGQSGKVASLVSHYRYGRKTVKAAPVQGTLPAVSEAKARLSTDGTIRDVQAGMLPLVDGTYIPVYEVTTLKSGPDMLTQPEVTYYAMDTLEVIDLGDGDAADGYELEDDGPAPEAVE